MAVRPHVIDQHLKAIGRVIAVMRSNPAEPLRLDSMARIASMSRYHFLRVFEDVTQVSPGRFLAALRIEQARRLLLSTSHSVTSVCYDVGYSSLGTFTRLFANFVGASPAAFRHRMGRLNSCSVDELIAMYRSPPVSGPTISGEIGIPSDFSGQVFVGVFSSPIPRGRPACGMVATHEMRYELPLTGCRKRRHFLLAAGFPSNAGGCLSLSLVSVCVGSESFIVSDLSQCRDLALRPVTEYDPPILIALPLLFEPDPPKAPRSSSVRRTPPMSNGRGTAGVLWESAEPRSPLSHVET
jgi:AraC family transcriptional regulator